MQVAAALYSAFRPRSSEKGKKSASNGFKIRELTDARYSKSFASLPRIKNKLPADTSQDVIMPVCDKNNKSRASTTHFNQAPRIERDHPLDEGS